MITSLDEKGKLKYNWSYVNNLFDFLIENHIKPFIELGFMSSSLNNSENRMFYSKTNKSQANNMEEWKDLVEEFVKNCVNRYGLEEVESWYFEVWKAPNLEHAFWNDGKERYFEFYKQTVAAVKSISSTLKVGGPAISYQDFDCYNK